MVARAYRCENERSDPRAFLTQIIKFPASEEAGYSRLALFWQRQVQASCSLVFSASSVVKGFRFLQRRKTFNTEKTENTEKWRTNHDRHESRKLMGRTVPTFRQLVDDAIARWAKFRRALRREDQEYFDRLFRRVRSYTQAATYQASDNPMEAILLSIALDQEKRLDALERARPRRAAG